MGPFGEKVINDNGDELIVICEQNSLKILNGYFKNKGYISTHDTKIQRS